MNIRKVLAGSMAAVAAGATIAFGAFAQTSGLGGYVDTSGSTPVPPWVVIGAGNGNPEYAKDVVGAADIAAAMAGYATKDRAIGGSAEVSVSGGVSLSTANTKIYGGDAISVAKDTLTSEDLPTILASGTFEDDDGNTYDYDQYIVVGNSAAVLSGSNDDDVLGEDPAILINIGTSSGSPAYIMKIIFNDDLNFSDSDVDGNELNMFGTSYTISSDSDTDTLVLYGGANKQTLSEGESGTISVGGVSYDVTLMGVSDENTIVVKIGGESRSIDEGQSRKIGGVDVYCDEVYYLSKETQTSSAKLSFGSAKLTLDDGDEVSVGSTDPQDIDNTLVTFTQGTEGTSVLEIAVAAEDSEGDFASEGKPFTDTVFGTFKLACGGGSPALADMELLDFDTSGDDTATAKFTDSGGDSKTIEFAYDSVPGTAGTTLALADSDNDAIIVVEGQNATEDDYILINQDDFAHLLEVTDIDADTGDTDPTITFSDVFSGTNYEVQMEEYGSTGEFNGTKVIDGKTYLFWSSDQTTDVVAIVWDDDATNPATVLASGVDVGNTTTVFPTIIAARDSEVAFIDDVNIGADLAGTTTVEMLGISFTLANGTNTITGTGIDYEYFNSTGLLKLEGVTDPAIGILEEEGENTAGNDVQNIVIVEAGDDADGITIQASSSSPIFSDAAATSWLSTSDNDIDVKSDRYGTVVYQNSDEQGTVEVYYPDNQVIMAVGIGTDPVFSVSGEGGTVKEASKITTPIAKLANEVSTGTLNRDIILLGGPCANTLVNTLMGSPSNCLTPFADLNVGMIKNYNDAFGSGQKALVVAGLSGDDTRALAAKVMQGTTSYSA